MPYFGTHLSNMSIQWIAALSSVTAFVASLTTTLPAIHEYLSRIESYKPISTHWKILRYSTYAAGLVDSGANGLGNFLGIVTIANDILHISLYNYYVILIAMGCGISATLLNFSFSIRQGFNEVVNYFSKEDIIRTSADYRSDKVPFLEREYSRANQKA